MTDRLKRFCLAIDNHIHVWSLSPSLAPLAEVLERDREILSSRLISLTEQEAADADTLRLLILHYALDRICAGIHPDHFTLFREPETVRVILEDSYGILPGVEKDEILIPHQDQAIQVIVRCLIRGSSKAAGDKDLLCFLSLFSGTGSERRLDQDRTMRFRSMVWLVYLAIETVGIDREVCRRGFEYFRYKFKVLLEHVLEGGIIDEESKRPGFEAGRWEASLWGWLQGDDRKEFVMKLKRQFNLENKTHHANRYLLAEHRRCVFEQVMNLFC
ncbi:MAG: hypothetical protein AB9866_03665 [Syntrophobacteraceae bacterium]